MGPLDCGFAAAHDQEEIVIADVSRQTYPFSLPDLPYAYDALEPHIDRRRCSSITAGTTTPT